MVRERSALWTRARNEIGLYDTAISENRRQRTSRARNAESGTEVVHGMSVSPRRAKLRQTEVLCEVSRSHGERRAYCWRRETGPRTAGKHFEINVDAQAHDGVEIGAVGARKGRVVGGPADARNDALALR
ncbi:hypothetical protein EXIGLDRAFT_382997 [Exidia glandulosa HHB12029]|uniref:Uncharacterized protein n=1 Tax=Exidia glandulosa HHB12029 TaxID=1314781 RepID=A0A166B266_EXIGL|nr:hypothetical protein EXIGLDRAFT_382997 [Exidia glandulosa HHB12029]